MKKKKRKKRKERKERRNGLGLRLESGFGFRFCFRILGVGFGESQQHSLSKWDVYRYISFGWWQIDAMSIHSIVGERERAQH